MPFVTEELWQRLPHGSSSAAPSTPHQPTASANGSHPPNSGDGEASNMSIMMQPYPEPQQAWQNPEVEEHMQLAENLLRAVRKLRGDYGLQRQRPQLFIQVRLIGAWT